MSIAFIYEHENNAFYDTDSDICHSSLPVHLAVIAVIFDLGVSILSLYLFTKKLPLINQVDNKNNENNDAVSSFER